MPGPSPKKPGHTPRPTRLSGVAVRAQVREIAETLDLSKMRGAFPFTIRGVPVTTERALELARTIPAELEPVQARRGVRRRHWSRHAHPRPCPARLLCSLQARPWRLAPSFETHHHPRVHRLQTQQGRRKGLPRLVGAPGIGHAPRALPRPVLGSDDHREDADNGLSTLCTRSSSSGPSIARTLSLFWRRVATRTTSRARCLTCKTCLPTSTWPTRVPRRSSTAKPTEDSARASRLLFYMADPFLRKSTARRSLCV